MDNIARKIEIFVIVSIMSLIGIIYAFKQKAVLAPTVSGPIGQMSVKPGTNDQPASPSAIGSGGPEQQQMVPTTTIEYQGQDGQTALDLLKNAHRVEAKHYSFGDLVTSIDGIAPDSKHFWSFYINGQFSQVGASTYVTKSSDQIKWQIDAVVDTTK